MDSAVGNSQTLKVGVDRTGEIGNNDALTVGVDSVEQIGNDADVLYRLEDEHAVTGRLATAKDGRTLYLVNVFAEASRYEDLAEDFLRTISSFRLTNPRGVALAETTSPWKNDAAISVRFDLLDSWDASIELNEGDRCTVNLTSEYEETITGRMHLEICSRCRDKTAIDVAQSYSNRLKQMGMHVDGAPLISIDPLDRFSTAWAYNPRASYDSRSFDAPALIIENEALVVRLALLGTSRDESPEWWAINKRAFEIVRDSLQVEPIADSFGRDHRRDGQAVCY